MYLVFSQDSQGTPDTARLVAHAKRFFASELVVLSQARFQLVSAGLPAPRDFSIVVRDVTASDLHAARAAEARGRAAGMSALAERCPRIWQLSSVDAQAGPVLGEGERLATPSRERESDYLLLAAICASVALGPVLPPDHGTLFGVRGAIERRDALLRQEAERAE